MSRSVRALAFVLAVAFSTTARAAPDTWENRVVPIAMAISGLGIAGMWTMDIFTTDVMADGFFSSRNAGGDLMWLHWTAEYLTAGALLAGAVGLWQEKDWGKPVAFVALGALTYTSINSLGWAFAEPDRIAYAIPILVSLATGSASITILF